MRISLVRLAVALPMVSVLPCAAAAQTSSACYVPGTGVVYRIKQTGLPSACRSATHVEFSWDALADGSVVNSKLADGAVTSTKIAAGAVGSTQLAAASHGSALQVNIADLLNLGAVHTLAGSITVAAPGPGRVMLTFTGTAIIFGDGTEVNAWIGTTLGGTDLCEQDVGFLDGTGTLRRKFNFACNAVVTVAAGSTTFYATLQRNPTFAAVQANLTNLKMTAVFIPN